MDKLYYDHHTTHGGIDFIIISAGGLTETVGSEYSVLNTSVTPNVRFHEATNRPRDISPVIACGKHIHRISDTSSPVPTVTVYKG